MKNLILIEIGLVVAFVFLISSAFSSYNHLYTLYGVSLPPGISLAMSAIEIDALFACIFVILLIIISRSVKKSNEAAPPQIWPLRLGIVFALASLFSLLGFLITRTLPANTYDPGYSHPAFLGYARLFLIDLSLPGLIFGILGIIAGILAYKKEHSRIALVGIILALTSTLLFGILSLNTSGAPFVCTSDSVCDKNGLGECISYSGYRQYERGSAVRPGFCIFIPPGGDTTPI